VIRILGAVASVMCFAATCSHADGREQEAFLHWARGALVPLSGVTASQQTKDLRPLSEMIGDASIVALSEGGHAGAEPLEFRNRVFQYLVEENGFTAIAIESGIVEGRRLHDYVLGGGDLRESLTQGLSWTFDRLPQNEALVRWIREYNSNPRVTRKINIYGFDVPGSPGNPMANRGTETALTEALNYLSRVDPNAAGPLRSRVGALLPRLQFNPAQPAGTAYHTLSSAERDQVTATIADVIALIERRQAVYIAASSSMDYEWAHRAAIGARQVDGWLRNIPVGWQPSMDFRSAEWRSFFSPATDVRDRAQADNVDWVVKQEGASGKVMLFASIYHLSTAPVKSLAADIDPASVPRQEVAGTYLRRRFGDRLFTIGNVLGHGKFGCAGFTVGLERSPRESLDGLIGELGVPLFLLDLRAAPAPVMRWLAQDRPLGHSDRLLLPVGNAFDALFYVDTVTEACPG
jgi:erythromycin esterase